MPVEIRAGKIALHPASSTTGQCVKHSQAAISQPPTPPAGMAANMLLKATLTPEVQASAAREALLSTPSVLQK